MKTITVLVLCLLALSAVAKKERLFLDFQSIIDHVNDNQKSWKAGHNNYFDGMDLEQVKHLMGTLETPEHLKLPLKNIEPLQDIPEEFFSAQAWPNCESIKEVRDQDDIMIITRKGVVIRCAISQLIVRGRATQGVKLIAVDEGDVVMDVAHLVKEDEE